MKKRVHHNKHQNPKMEVQQLPSKAEIKKRESKYQKDLADFKGGLIAGERYKKNGILKLANDLEEAGTVEIHLISKRIRADLKPITDRQLLATTYITQALPEKYRRDYRKTKPTEQQETESKKSNFGQIPTQTETPITTTFTSTATGETTTELPTKQPSQEEREFEKYVDQLYNFIYSLTELLTGLKQDRFKNYTDNVKLVSDTKRRRFDVAKRLEPLDLNTIYDDCGRLRPILDDFVEHLYNERGSRRKQQNLTSE
jgi:hypothetical protein